MNTPTTITGALGLIVASYLMKKYNLDYILFGTINMAFTAMLAEIEWIYHEYKFVVGGFGIFILCCYYLYKFWSNRSINTKSDEYSTVCLYKDRDIQTFYAYINDHPQYFDIPEDVEYGDPNEIIEREITDSLNTTSDNSRSKRSKYDVKVDFNDADFNVSGYYIWTKNTVEINSVDKRSKEAIKVAKQYSYLSIFIKKPGNADTYFSSISKLLSESNANECVLYHEKLIIENYKVTYNIYEIYRGNKIKIEDLEKQFMAPFFHEQKDYLWNIIKTVHFEPDKIRELGSFPRCSFLFYGPPGTGKSNFPYRVARCLNRHVISLDLRKCNRESAYKILRRPYIYDSSNLGTIYLNPKDVVFIFDEFDLTVTELATRSKLKSSIDTKYLSYFDMFVNDIDTVDNLANDKDKKTFKYSDYRSSYYNESDLTLDDLLEILQGPVPNEGSLIFATTNRYEDIKNACPALVRYGRLTPVYFPNITTKTLNDITRYYFDQETKLVIPPNCDILPAQAVDYAINVKRDGKGLDIYENLIADLITKNTIN